MPDENDIDEVSDGVSENEYDDLDTGKDDHDDENMGEDSYKHEDDGDQNGGSEMKKPKLDPKDPLRPRRKKARRACFACQRAHLTCGMFHPVYFPCATCAFCSRGSLKLESRSRSRCAVLLHHCLCTTQNSVLCYFSGI